MVNRSSDRPRFSLRHGLTSISAFCGGAAAVHWFGFDAVMQASIALAILTLVMIVWTCAYLHAPELTTYATVFAIMALFAVSLAAPLLVHSRENARQIQLRSELRDLGWFSMKSEELYPRDPKNSIGEEHWLRLLEHETAHGAPPPESWAPEHRGYFPTVQTPRTF
jgi:hypothetical protein